MAKRLVHHECYSSVTALSSPCDTRVLISGGLIISQELLDQKHGLHACSCCGIGLGSAAVQTVTAAAAAGSVAQADGDLHKTASDKVSRSAPDSTGVENASSADNNVHLQYELVLDSSSWDVLEVSGSCCGTAWDPLRCQLCPGALGLLLHARFSNEQVCARATKRLITILIPDYDF